MSAALRKFLEQTAVLAGASTNNLIKIVFGEERKERLNKKELSREEKRSSISSINSIEEDLLQQLLLFLFFWFYRYTTNISP